MTDRPPLKLDLMGVTEVGQRLGVSRQRASQLWYDHPRFPVPVAILSTGPVWLTEQIEEFAKLPRKAGRPKKESGT